MRVGVGYYTQLQLYITKGPKSPTGWLGCVRVCVCVSPPLFDFEVVTLSGAEAESRRWENGALPPEGRWHIPVCMEICEAKQFGKSSVTCMCTRAPACKPVLLY